MNTLQTTVVGLLASCMLTLPAMAGQDEHVDFNAVVTSVMNNRIVVRQMETGQNWVVSNPNGNRGNYNGSFQVGQAVHILGIQGSGDRIRADQINGISAYNSNQYNPYQNNPQNYPYSTNPYYNGSYQTNVPSGTVYINSPAQGTSIPGNFNIQGSAAPYSQIRVGVNSQRTLLPGLLNIPVGQGQEMVFTGQADSNGHFDVPVQTGNAGSNAPVQVNVSVISPGGAQSQTQTLNLVRQ